MANQEQKNRPILNRDRLKGLLKQERAADQPRISIYLSLHPTGTDREADLIVYKNLLAEAETELDKRYPRRSWEESMKRLRRLPEEEALFIQRKLSGMVILASGESLDVFQLMHKLDSGVFVSKSFHVLPLLAFYEAFDEVILAELGRDRVRLYAANRYGIEPYRAPDIITNFDELFDDFDNDSNVNFGSYGGQTGQGGMYHGHRTSSEEADKDRDKYFRYLDEGFSQLHRHEKQAVLLAGTSATIAHFRKVSRGRFYLEHTLDKPLDTMEQAEILAAVQTAMTPLYKEAIDEISMRLRRAQSDGRTEHRISHIHERVLAGAVDELLINYSRIRSDDTSLDKIILDAMAVGSRVTVLTEATDNFTAAYLAILRY